MLARSCVQNRDSRIGFSVCLLGLVGLFNLWVSAEADPVVAESSEVDFSQSIKPLLSDRCFKCHGADEGARKAGLRLDLEEGLFGVLRSGEGNVIVAGKVEESEMWRRIQSSDIDDRMPPSDSGLELSSEERALIRRWIEQGAEWKSHWAFEPIAKPALPEGSSRTGVFPDGAKNPIDHFVGAKLEELGLRANPEADKATLIRRLSFDLTGLPPSLEEIDAFLSDPAPSAYGDLVERFFATDAYAERMTMEWLDVARYGDTQGMHGDRERFHWPWRDWVIQAFRENMSYDDFVIWQLAGDLLPGATREQRLATAFHRNHPVSAEGGIIDEEFRVKYVQDRANTTATAFLGLTLECATCHDHKFDPVSQKEYYQMSAFFNNQKEIGMVAEGGGSSGPVLLLPGAEAESRIRSLSRRITETRDALKGRAEQIASAADFASRSQGLDIPVPRATAHFPLDSFRTEAIKVKGAIHRVVRNTPIDKIVDDNPSSVASGEPELVPGRIGKALRVDKEYDLVFLRDVGKFEMNQPFSAGAWIRTEKQGENQTIMGISGDLTSHAWRGWDFFLDSKNRLSLRMIGYWPHNYLQVTTEQSIDPNSWRHVAFTYDGMGSASGVHLYIGGRKVTQQIDYDDLYRTIVHPWGEQEGWPQKPVMVGRSGRFYTGENGVFLGSFDDIKIYHRYLTAREVAAWVAGDAGASGAEQGSEATTDLDHELHRNDAVARELIDELRQLLGQKLEAIKGVPEIMVMQDMEERRATYVLNRGQYDAPTELVEPGTPDSILPFPDELPRNRLGLAQWLVNRKNPLTARVTVNRYWQMIFGQGIVATPQDFGSQGALPSHPKLLDWLASQFVESGWDVRALLRTMVTSATYRQSSAASHRHLEVDPANRLLGRGPSDRMPAEMIRDNALVASGLLTRKVGGASVKPYQPKGLWIEKTGPGNSYKHDEGEALYRRSLYTYIRRTTPHPAMIAFDAPNRSVCTVRRERTNTPLQALVLLNDPQFFEASRVLAQRIQREGGETVDSQISYGFRLLCGRFPTGAELRLLVGQFEVGLERFENDAAAAKAILEVGEYETDESLDKKRTAALTLVANTILNFDESYSKR